MWLKELKLDKEYDKAIKQVRVVAEKKEQVQNGNAEIKNNGVRGFELIERGLQGLPDIIEVFGPTRSLKTFLAYKFAVAKAEAGKEVIYIDTEGNMTKEQIEGLKKAGCKYEDIINFDKLVKRIQTLESGYDYVVIDSIGLPALGKFALSNMKEKGNILLNVQAILYVLKDYCRSNGAVALVTNQPVSEMGKAEYFTYNGKRYLELPPFGDKGSFFVKEIYRTIPIKQSQSETVVDVVAWGSRILPKYAPVCRLVRKGNELEIREI